MQCYLRRPSGRPEETGTIGEKRPHLRIRRPAPLLVLENRLVAGCKLNNDVNQIADLDRPLAAGIICLTEFDVLGETGSHECGRGIANKCEVSDCRSVTDHYRGAGWIERL